MYGELTVGLLVKGTEVSRVLYHPNDDSAIVFFLESSGSDCTWQSFRNEGEIKTSPNKQKNDRVYHQ